MNRWLNCFALLLFLAFIFLSHTPISFLNGVIDLNDLPNYANQSVPNYINKDNTPVNNPITDAGATLGRVLFYDQQLSVNNTISCASCHLQEFGFSDIAQQSTGQSGGLTGRHAMRLVNARFSVEARFFWDERAMTLEAQSTQPIQDHIEMGFSGEDGDPPLDSLFRRMEALDYYQLLFTVVYGDAIITEERMQLALAQFIRSIQSFDSKYDAGRAMVDNNNMNFPNFTEQENMGKRLFMRGPGNDGAGCNACHRAPEFDIDPISRNNGVIGVAGEPGGVDLTNIRAPSLRDMINPDGVLNGPLMHDGSLATLEDVIEHYNQIEAGPFNNNLDPRLRGGQGGMGQNLNLTDEEKAALVAFLETLTGSDLYTNEKWSDPFDENGELIVVAACGLPVTSTLQVIICAGETYEGYTESGTYQDSCLAANGCDSIRTINLTVLDSTNPACLASSTEAPLFASQLQVFPNPFRDILEVSCDCQGNYWYTLYNANGQALQQKEWNFSSGKMQLSTVDLPKGVYFLSIQEGESGGVVSRYVVKN